MTTKLRSLSCRGERALAILIFLLAAACLMVVSPGAARADSPLTSTDFALAYQDVPEVAQTPTGKLDERTIETLMDETLANDVRAAIVNALGWSIKGQENAEVFLRSVARRRGVPADRLTAETLEAPELFVLGYLLAMDDFQRLSPIGGKGPLREMAPAALLAAARKKAPQDFTIALVESLVHAQPKTADDWCGVFTTVNDVVATFPGEKTLRKDAIEIVMEYIEMYQAYCAAPDAP